MKRYLHGNSLTVVFILAATLVLTQACGNGSDRPLKDSVIAHVNPFIGTGFHGHTFPGPVMPYGMVQLSPDTHLLGWDASSGYHYGDSIIYGFTHTHLSGTGIGDMGDVLLLPYTRKSEDKPVGKFTKENEQASPGYYKVGFDNHDVDVELTVTNRVGLHRYTFGPESERYVLLDIGHILQANWGHANVENSLVQLSDKSLSGMKHSTGWAFDHRVHFYMETSSPFTLERVVVDGNLAIGEKFKGKSIQTYLRFDNLEADESLLIKVAISPVDEVGAKMNMTEELAHWNFEMVRTNVEKSWDEALQKIHVKTDDQDLLTTFYTALYHTMIAPMTYQDVDGRYRGMDLQVHQAEQGSNFTVYSLWDTFRALHPLMTLLDEERSVAWVNNLLKKYEEGGILPMWPLNANYTGTMVGYPAVANIADALAKGLEGIDHQKALKAALRSARYDPELFSNAANPRMARLMPPYNKYVERYRYIPADSIEKSVSFGLEMAYYDWCIAEIAAMAGDSKTETEFRERATYYKNYFDPETGFMRGKNGDGSWETPFNPRHSSHEGSSYVEGTAWQWNWFVPHDINGFTKLYGSREAVITKLDSLFSTSSEVVGQDASGDITGLIGQYAHGNEPSHHIAFMYTHLGKPHRTQELVDYIMKEFYTSAPDGIIGNEDCGQMSAWYVMNAMGFYQMTPGNPEYTLGRPLFDKVSIPLENGATFTITTENNSPKNKYIQRAYMNGEKMNSLTFSHQDVLDGALLHLVMGPEAKSNTH
jgi:predicted alpha-1,2-mannosidase